MKVVVVGDKNSGKEIILDRFIDKGSQNNDKMSVGFGMVIIPIIVNEQNFKIQIYELNEEERFDNVRRVYCFGALGGILVFNVTKRETFDSLEDWSTEIWENNGEGVIPLVIFGINVENRDQSPNSVTKEQGMEMASKISKKAMKEGYEIPYYEISIETGENIDNSLKYFAKACSSYLDQNR